MFSTSGSPGNLKNLVTLGNPNLKAETADNIDVLVERYLNPFGMISAGYFYKRLTDPIVTQTFTLTNFQPVSNRPPGNVVIRKYIVNTVIGDCVSALAARAPGTARRRGGTAEIDGRPVGQERLGLS